ncbi:glycoside hydrolase [Alkalihalobacillus sp. 1P02AB]|uniref:glycoside hydrolase n=1 Tax=Alkalihalobacillus sp. 1P02AB TaxID=3132260 RepID=UPI0039A42767
MKSRIRNKMKKTITLGFIALLLFGLLMPITAFSQSIADNSSEVDKVVKLDPSYQHEPFDGWGTALVWFANVTGGWPDDIKMELADALFGEDGLDFNIARYNIGGQDAPETEPYMRLGGAVPGYWDRPDEFGPPDNASPDWEEVDNWWDSENTQHWDWNKDKNQQWWLKAAKNRGVNLFEAFSNSPPYFMTNSGYTSGHFDSWQDNLRTDQYENFAIYLTRVVEYLQNDLGIDIQTLSPVNEPNTGYWGAKGRQEGSNWTPESQARIINEVGKQLEELNLDTVISAMDETHPQRFRENWEKYDEATKANVGQMNVHTYWPAEHTAIRDIAKGEEKRLWMSEVDLGPSGMPQDFDNIEPGLALSNHIMTDITNLEPKAWVLWQAIEDQVNMNADYENMNWGLIHVDFDPDDFSTLEWHKNKKYYTMGNYTKFIRPGQQFINSDDQNTLAAIDQENKKVVVVYTNHANDEQTIDFDLSGFETISNSATATPYVTSSEDNLIQKEDVTVSDGKLSTTVEAKSVTTFVISDVSGVNENASFLKSDVEYKIVNKNSGLVLDKDENEKASVVQYSDDHNNVNQEWFIEKVTDGYTNTEKYKIISAENKEVLTNVGGTAVLGEDENLPTQRWIISTNGSGEFTFINEGSKDLLEVGGQSKEEGASVGLWRPNAGSNQVWGISEAGITSIENQNIWTTPGIAPTLPDEVTVSYSNGKTVDKAVDWEEIDAEQYETENQFVVEGSVDGTSVKAKATIYVSEVANIVDEKVKTVAGIHPELPEEVAAELNIGVKVMLPVKWDNIDPSLYKEIGEFSVSGLAEGTNLEAIAYVKVAEREIANLALNTGSEYPKASASFTGNWDNVNYVNDGDYSSDRWTNWDPNEWRENDWVEIDFGKEEIISEVKFTFYDDETGTRPPESLYLEYWDGSDWIEIPDTHLDVMENTEATLKFTELETSKIRAMLTAMHDACIAIVEMEVMGISSIPVLGSDATLKSISVNGNELEGFHSDDLSYEVILDADESEVLNISVTTSDLFANYEISLPSSLPGEAYIKVTSEDEKDTRTYTISFIISDEEGTVDKTKLEEAVKEAKELEAEKYSASSWEALEEALTRAEQVLASEKASQEEIDKALAELQLAIENLEVKEEGTVDKTKLEEAVKEAKELEAEKYSTSSWEALEAALSKAEQVLASEKASQEEIDKALAELQLAIENLEVKEEGTVDKTQLEKAVKEAKELEAEKYSASSWAALEAALSKAEQVLASEKASQEEIDKALAELQLAIENLEVKEEGTVDKTKLEEAVKEAKELEAEKYSTSSWEALEAALSKAEQVLASEKASQEEIDKALAELQLAIENLEVKEEGTVDKTKLEKAIKEAKELEAEKYSASSWEALEAALSKAGQVLASEKASQEEIDKALAELQLAIENLKTKTIVEQNVIKAHDNNASEKDEVNDSLLPKTATSIFNFLLVGFILSMAGAMLFFLRRKRAH